LNRRSFFGLLALFVDACNAPDQPNQAEPLPPPPEPPSVPFSYNLNTDTFTRANSGNLGANWTTFTGGIEGGTIGITANAATPQSSGVNCSSFYSAAPATANQWGVVKVGVVGVPTTTTGGGIILRASTGGGGPNYYRAFLNYGVAASVFLNLGKSVNGTLTGIGGAGINLGALAYGAVMYFEIIGSTMNCYVNGTLQQTATDTDLANGVPGVTGFNQSGTQQVAMTNWRGGDLVWTRKGTVIPVGQANTSGNGNQEPSVIFEGGAQILSGNVFKIWHTTGWVSPVPNIDYAESSDGITWTESASNPRISNGVTAVVHGGVNKIGSTYYAYMGNVASGANITFDQWTSSDGFNWTLAHAGVLTAAGSGTEVGIFNPFVWLEGGVWYMFYDGSDVGNAHYNLRLATSTDGITWAKDAANPIITLGSGSISSADMHKIGGVYYILLHGAVSGNLPSDVYLYSSTDLHNWTASPQNPIVFRLLNDEGPDVPAAGQLADSSMIELNGVTYLYNDATRAQSSGQMHINLRTFAGPMQNILPASMFGAGPQPQLGGGDLGPGFDFKFKL
jgi:hypothetical protein